MRIIHSSCRKARLRVYRAALAAMGASALSFACANPVEVLESTSTQIGAEGGVAHSADGRLRITIAPGALSREEELVIRTDRSLDLAGQSSLAYAIDIERPLEVRAESAIARSGEAPEKIVRIEHGAPVEIGGVADQEVVRADLGRVEPATYCAMLRDDIAGCGDGTCDSGEDCSSCPGDCGACGPVCGDGACDGGENCAGCPGDCGACTAVCGDGTCERGVESCMSCASDCGICPAICGDGTCSALNGENCSSCASDCGACPSACGDGACSAGEDCGTCASDCGACPSCSTHVVQLAAEFDSICAVLDNGTVSCIGAFEGSPDAPAPTLVRTSSGGPPLTDVVRVIVGEIIACAIKTDTTVWCWTMYYRPPFDRPHPYPFQLPAPGGAGPLTGVVDGDATYDVCLELDDGTAACWQEFYGTEPLLDASGAPFDSIRALSWSYGSDPIVQRNDGTVWTFNPSRGEPPALVLPGGQPMPAFDEVEIGFVGSPDGMLETACGLKADDTLLCWGENWWGNLGDGTDVDHELPAPVLESAGGPVFGDVRAFDVDYWSVTCAVKNDGSVWCWGRNYEGQLGNDFNAIGDRSNSPLQVIRYDDQPFTDAVDLQTASLTLCVLTSGGEVWCWGYGAQPIRPHPLDFCP